MNDLRRLSTRFPVRDLHRPPPHPSDNGRQVDGHVVCFYDIDQLPWLFSPYFGTSLKALSTVKTVVVAMVLGVFCVIFGGTQASGPSPRHHFLDWHAAFVFLTVVILRQSIIARINITAAISG